MTGVMTGVEAGVFTSVMFDKIEKYRKKRKIQKKFLHFFEFFRYIGKRKKLEVNYE